MFACLALSLFSETGVCGWIFVVFLIGSLWLICCSVLGLWLSWVWFGFVCSVGFACRLWCAIPSVVILLACGWLLLVVVRALWLLVLVVFLFSC